MFAEREEALLSSDGDTDVVVLVAFGGFYREEDSSLL